MNRTTKEIKNKISELELLLEQDNYTEEEKHLSDKRINEIIGNLQALNWVIKNISSL